ncbi:MAG: hypothetical protein Q9212_000624 [Teloschistes hypoglaucus]
MSRRGYASSELYEERERDRERDYYPPRDRGGRTAEYDEIDIRERRRTSAREPDFLREGYGRSSAGPLVIRDEKRERESEYRPRPSGRARETEEREVIVARGPRSERPTERDINIDREELVYRTREPERPRTREINIERDDIIYRPPPREPEPQQVRRVREDWEYRRPREPEIERETIDIRERERERPRERERERDFQEEEIIIRRRSASRERERPREREYKDQEIVIRRSSRSRERERPREREIREEDIIIRRDERERERPRPREPERGYEKDEIIIRRSEGERDRPRARASSFDRETIKLRVDEREPRRAKSRGDFREEDITIRREERERPSARSRDYREEDLIVRRRDASRETRRTARSKSRSRDREDITIRHDDRGGRHRDEIIIRRDERSPSPEPVYAPPPPAPEPEPIRAPPIHQEIITHHRHIDHGFETRAPAPAPALPPPRPRSPSPPKSTYDEIEIRRRSSRNGRHYDEDLIITERERDGDRRHREEDHAPRRRRSPSFDARSRAPYSSRDELDIAEEADYYNSRAAERSYLGEGYNGANKDWAIVDVPPGTKRVEMEGIGGAREEITWQRYNGVRRSKFIAEEDEYRARQDKLEVMAPTEHAHPRVESTRYEQGRRYVGEKDKKEKMWTEITKDLVTEDAIQQMGYDFEETEFFYYVMSYLKYASSSEVLRLVELSEELKHDRRERIREIEREQRLPAPKPRLALTGRPWDEERIVEREIIYEGTPPPRRYR